MKILHIHNTSKYNRLLKAAWMTAVMLCVMLCAGCGDVEEPVAADPTQIVKSEGYIVVPENLTALGYEYVYLFAEPDAGSALVLQLFDGTAIDIYDVRGQWYYAGVEDKRGYVQAESVSLTPPEERVTIRTEETTVTTTEVVTTPTTVATTAATEPPVEETEPPEEEEEEETEETTAAAETNPADAIPGVPPVNMRVAPFFNDIYIYNSAPENADGQRFTLHAGGTYDYWVADIYVHSPDASKIKSFTARGTDVDTWLESGSCYDYVTVTIVPYYNDGASGNTTTVRYNVITG